MRIAAMIGGVATATILAIAAPVVSAAPIEPAANSGASTERPIRLGMSTALSGPAADLGIQMSAGVRVAIDEINAAGGIGGRTIELVALDDGYEPARTGPNMDRLIGEERVHAIIGNVGTPTAVTAIPIANREAVPFFGAFTGAGVLRRTPPDRYVINVRTSYAEETAAMVDALIEHAGLAPEEIGFFTQRDSYGDAGYAGGLAALKRHGLSDENAVAHGRYERNTLAVERGLAELVAADPPARAVIMVGAYGPCAKFIRLAREFDVAELFLNVSFVGARAMAEILGPVGDGVIVTQVVPHLDSDVPIVASYRHALAAHAADMPSSYASLEGYLAARILFRAIDGIDGPVTRESIVDALDSLGTFDMGLGVDLSLGPDDHQACDDVWPTVLRDGAVVPFDWRQLASTVASAGGNGS